MSGRLLERGALRYTPAGVPVVEFLLGHQSQQQEADTERRVNCEVACVVIGPLAHRLSTAGLGDGLLLSGFLAARSLKRPSPVLHVNTIEFVEGTENGF